MSTISLARRPRAEGGRKFTSADGTLLGPKACPLVQITLCTKWWKVMQLMTKVSSKQFKEITGNETSISRTQSVFISSRDPWLSRCLDWISADCCLSSQEVSTVDHCAILCAGEPQVGWTDCGAARVERPLLTLKELAKSDLQSKRGSSDGQDGYQIHQLFEFSELKDWLGRKWSATNEASSNSCYNSNVKCRW